MPKHEPFGVISICFKEGEEFIADQSKVERIFDAADKFSLIGIMEDLPGAVSQLYSDFGQTVVPAIPRLQVGDVNVSRHTNREAVPREPITREIAEQLDLLTVYDRPLYEYVKSKLANKSNK